MKLFNKYFVIAFSSIFILSILLIVWNLQSDSQISFNYKLLCQELAGDPTDENEGIQLTKKTLSGVSSQMLPVKPTNQNNSWEMEIGPNGEKENLDWLLN